MAHITVNGKPLCTFGITVVNCINPDYKNPAFRYIYCGWATLKRAEEAVEVLRKLNPDRKPESFQTHERSCPTLEEQK